MLKILINGINGKMGKEVASLIKKQSNMHLLCGFDRHIMHNLPHPVYNDFNQIYEIPDVIIDFSVPEGTINILDFAAEKKIPIVIATTGFSEDEQSKIFLCSSKIPVFQSANMSYELSLMKKIVTELSKNLQNSEIEIVETHHSQKKDAPSGTALMLANSIQEASANAYHYEFSRLLKNEIGFSSIRGGNIVGEHSVMFFNENETFEVKHTAYSRTIFAEGAIKAAEYIIKQPIGYYTCIE